LLVTRDGLAESLTDGHGILLGTGVRTPRTDPTLVRPPGSTLLRCTDGLVEAPGHTPDQGVHALRRHGAGLAHRPLPSLPDQLLRRVQPPGHDDIALLALRTPGRDGR